MRNKKMLLIGWDAADWQVIEPLIQEAKMPALASLMQTGVSGNIATLSPTLSPMLWTSIATGKRAYDHGVCGFVDIDATRAEVLPVQSTSRRCKAVWNILNEAGLKTNLVNWWPSHPAEKVNGVSVSNHFHKAAPAFGIDWPLESSAIYPKKYYHELRELRLHPAELTLAHVLPFIPEANKLDPENDPVLKPLLRVLAHASSVHNATTLLMEENEWDFMAVYHEAIDHFSHLAMKYHPPKLNEVSEKDFRLYHKVVKAAYQFHDMMLDRLLQLAGPECDVVLLSDHGFQSGQLRIPELPDIAAAPALEHRKYGVFVASGPSFKSAEKVYGASLLDITPSILHNFGLPVGEDMEGRVLRDIFRKDEPISRIPSWEPTGVKPQFVAEEMPSTDTLNQLQQLGYIDLKKDDRLSYVEHELLYNLCTSLLEGQKFDELREKARPAWEKSLDLRFGMLLAEVYLQQNDQREMQRLFSELDAHHPGNASILFLKGMWAMQHNEQQNALQQFMALEDKGVESVQLFNEIGKSMLVAGNSKAAISYFDKSLSRETHNATALTGKAQCVLELGKTEEAFRLLDKSLQLTFFQPNAHYLMAMASLKLKKDELAKKALQICLKQAPKHLKAAETLRHLLGHDSTSKSSEPIIIVSGFPRSGTSMMMKMLEQGGLKVFLDQKRKADIHNPRGYYEHSAVKELGRQNEWIKEARGTVLKVVSPLLRYLPASEVFKVIIIKRPLTEVVVSQEIMKGRNREEVMKNFPFQMALELQNEDKRLLNWLEMQPNIEYMEVEYYDCFEKPDEVLNRIEAFTGRSLQHSLAKKVIDFDLHRNKLGKS